MARNSFVPENRPWILNCGADVKVLRLRIVSWNEIEAGWILIINTRRVHKTARTGWLERVWQLTNLKWSEVIRQGNEMSISQKLNHFLLATFVGFKERLLIGRHTRGA